MENLALRQQLSVFRRRKRRPKLTVLDKLFWVLACRLWSDWKKSLLVVAPETVVHWHRAGFRLYWSMISKIKKRVARRRIPREVRDLIFRIMAENPTWGAPRIHGELLMLGFDVSERSVSRWMKRAPRDPKLARRWLAFLRNHREAITAMDFFTVPTVTFQLLYCFFIIRLLGTTGGRFSTSTSPAIPPAAGSCSMHVYCVSQTCRTQLPKNSGISSFGRITSCDVRDAKTSSIRSEQAWDGGGLIPLATRNGRNLLRGLNPA